MATMYITEYGGKGANSAQIPMEPPLVTPQKIVFTSGTTASAALNTETKFVSIQLDVDGHIQFAGTPVATSTTSRIHKAYAVSFHGVSSGLKVAAVAI